jgi:lysophospholipase L1-like esterase
MFTAACRVLAAGVVLAGGLTVAVGGDDARPNPAALPLDRDNARHRQLLKLVARGGGDVVFLGDSITERWDSTGAKVWRETFAPLKAVNLGGGGDQTGHVLWRIREGKELESLTPRVAVVLIGINNPVAHRPQEVAGAVQAIVTELKKQKPGIKVLVLGVFPCSLRRQDKTVQRIGPADLQPRVKQLNAALAGLHDGKSVFFKDIGDRFLEPDGGLSREVMSDFLHLGPKGYQIWADAIQADVQKMLR